MKLSQRSQEEKTFVQNFLGTGVICEDCGATLSTYGSECTAELSEACPGFMKIEDAKDEFRNSKKVNLTNKVAR